MTHQHTEAKKTFP